ncbi:MAG: LuxR C-terminal-related transcriptional regulator [Bacteroidales bacterium]
MTQEKKIAIVTPCALCGHGLKQILSEFFGQTHCDVFNSADELVHQHPDSFDLYFLLAEPVLLNYDFFLPRRNKTIILTEQSNPSAGFITLRMHTDLSSFVDSLQEVLDKTISATKGETQEELSGREVEVLKLITRGLINKEIADELCISLNTVLTHRKNITSKLGIKTVSGLTFYAMMNGYID